MRYVIDPSYSLIWDEHISASWLLSKLKLLFLPIPPPQEHCISRGWLQHIFHTIQYLFNQGLGLHHSFILITSTKSLTPTVGADSTWHKCCLQVGRKQVACNYSPWNWQYLMCDDPYAVCPAYVVVCEQVARNKIEERNWETLALERHKLMGKWKIR